MKLNSIRVKLFFIIISAFFIHTVSILLISDKQLTKIIDTGKNTLYSERVDTIWARLDRTNERLKKTGLVEAYSDDFKESALRDLKHTYYTHPEPSIYPFIIDTDGNILMHPILPENSAPPHGNKTINDALLASDRGEIQAVDNGQPKYYTFRRFPPWQWVIVFEVPLDIKYAEAKAFRHLLVMITVGVTLLILLILIPVIAGFTKPITRLTQAAIAMAGGNLDKDIDLGSSDEIGTLSHGFNHMRNSIKQTIEKLERENTERKRAEQALSNEKEQLAVTLRSIGDGVITTDTQGCIVLMNKVAEQLTGWSGREADGCRLEKVFRSVDGKTGELNHNMVERIIENGRMIERSRQETLLSKTGAKRIISTNCAPIRDTYSSIIGVVLVFRDITNQVEIEQELLKSRKLESIGVLAGGIAHDFNNMLAAILGNIDLILMDEKLPEKTRHLLTKAEKASLRAKGLTRQLLTFSKGGAPVKEAASLENIIRDSAGFFLHGNKVACRFDIPKDLWPAEIDKGQISQVIQNIVINGSEAMSHSGTIHISCSNVVGGDDDTDAFLTRGVKYIAISIADSGIGISSSEIDRIFDPYFTTKAKGNGLGLSICHSIVSKHNGYIGVTSSPGNGTTFTVYLPASEGMQAIESSEKTMESGARNARVMIMDDEEPIRNMVGAMLNKMGHQPVMAVDGSEAVALYKKSKQSDTPIDIVIMDLTIPGKMGGQEAIAQLLAFDPQAKAIVSSGYSNDPVMADHEKFGFQAAIIKPYQYKELADIIDKTLATNKEVS